MSTSKMKSLALKLFKLLRKYGLMICIALCSLTQFILVKSIPVISKIIGYLDTSLKKLRGKLDAGVS